MIFVIVPTYKNSPSVLGRCLDSLREQDHPNFSVCVYDDGSPLAYQDFLFKYCNLNLGFVPLSNTERKGSLHNQWSALNYFSCKDDDIIVIVDGDDWLARSDALSIVQSYYDEGYLLTYGNYRNVPDNGDSQAKDYSYEVKLKNRYRRCGQLNFNHLRTFSYRLYKHLDPEVDFKFPNGDWFMTCADTAIMVPCLELAGGNYKFIDKVLYNYNSANPESDWRKNSLEIERTHSYILNNLKRKKPLNGIQVR